MNSVVVPKHSVIQYVRNNKRIPYGVIVAVKDEGGFRIGYSLCNKKDKFNKRMALNIAIGRTMNTIVNMEPDCKPHDIRKMLPSFVERCKKYYKVNSYPLMSH